MEILNIILNILLFIGAIAFMILIHEIGHFAASKAVGVEVEEFGLGFPPHALTLFEHKGTKYTLNWIPLGGFVRPKGEDDDGEIGGMAAAAPWKRFVILIAGPIMNLTLAILIYAFLSFQFGITDTSRVNIGLVSPGSPAEAAGLVTGDIITQVNDQTINELSDIQDEIYAHLGEPITVIVDRDGDVLTYQMIPRDPAPSDGAIGVGLGHPLLKANAGNALQMGLYTTYFQSKMILSMPFQILFSDKVSPEEARVVGYKGMYEMYDYMRDIDKEAAAAPENNGQATGYATLSFFAIVTVSLGIINLMPFPALDGGRILFLIPELIFRKRIPQKYENMVHTIGFIFLISLMVYVNVLDFIDPIQLPPR